MTLPVISWADKIDCYSGDKLIYSGIGKNFYYVDGLFGLTELNSNQDIFISGNCIVRMEKIKHKKSKRK